MNIMSWIRKFFINDDLPPGLKREDPEVIRQIMSTPGDPNDPELKKYLPYEFARMVTKALEHEKFEYEKLDKHTMLVTVTNAKGEVNQRKLRTVPPRG